MKMEIIRPIRLSKIRVFLIVITLINSCINAQDIKMGYMKINWLYGYTYSDTTYLLTDVITDINRPYIFTNWGVKIDTSYLIQTTLTSNGYLKKYYGTCTFPGPSPGFYNISNTNLYRISGVKNMKNSFSQPIKLTSLLNIQTFGSPVNSAPVLQNNTITLSAQHDSVIFKPQFYDPEGDSLSYQSTSCYGTNYYIPNGVTIDSYGNLYFHKDSLGIYAFSTIIKEWRKNDDGDYKNIQSSQIDFTIDITTDVSVSESKPDLLKLFPNPTNSILNITNEQNQFQHSTINIKNTLGQTVLSVPFQQETDVSPLSNGLYFLQLETEDKKLLNAKFIKE
jgi:hypothetical protein